MPCEHDRNIFTAFHQTVCGQYEQLHTLHMVNQSMFCSLTKMNPLRSETTLMKELETPMRNPKANDVTKPNSNTCLEYIGLKKHQQSSKPFGTIARGSASIEEMTSILFLLPYSSHFKNIKLKIEKERKNEKRNIRGKESGKEGKNNAAKQSWRTMSMVVKTESAGDREPDSYPVQMTLITGLDKNRSKNRRIDQKMEKLDKTV